MADECTSFLSDPFVFPRRPVNRPGLGHIGYRIGAYPEFREAILRRLNASVTLAAWTHREPDDPGIALVEGAAILGDILAFYQEHYANEAYLRTARWRESVADLVRLTGYRLAPGLGGRATFAIEVKGTKPVTIPAGLPLKADLAEVRDPGEFQTTRELIAHSHLSRFHLYRTRTYAAGLAADAVRVEIQSAGGASTPEALAALDIKKGDRLMLVPPEPAWTTSGSTLSAQKPAQVVKVTKVETWLGRIIVEFESKLTESWSAPVIAYRINRSFRHFGHNAPPRTITSIPSSGPITGATQSTTLFARHVYRDHDCGHTSASIALPAAFLPLDQEVNDLTVNARVIVQAKIRNGPYGMPYAFTVVKTITSMSAGALGFGALNGPSTFLGLDSPLVRHRALADPLSDVRDWRIHEVTSPAIALRAEATFAAGAIATGSNALHFYGTGDEAKALAGRRLLLEHADGRTRELTCTTPATSFPGVGGPPQMWALSFDRSPTPFLREHFNETAPLVAVFGNAVDATEGRAEREVPLGNGDGRQVFQTFKLPRAPLTYLPLAGATPPQAPELEVRVGARLWTRVDALFGRGPKDEIYIVREDADGSSYIQFGDGVTGARLPSGIKNVAVRFRTGIGAHGPLKPGAAPSAGERIEGMDKVHMFGVVSGGAQPESADKARDAAPGKLQSLGRLVSLRDFESEVLTIPGVTTATASWALAAGVPSVVLRVLLEAGREAEFAQVRATIAAYQRCRGPDRFPVIVEQALLRYGFLDVLYAFDARLRREDVETALRAALGVVGSATHLRGGLFALTRGLGEREYASRIEGVLQQVAGVSWCTVRALGLFAAGVSDPAALALPPAPRPVSTQLVCADRELLQLHPSHLSLAAAPVPGGACA